MDGLEQDYSISSANTLEILQSVAKPLIYMKVGHRMPTGSSKFDLYFNFLHAELV